MVSSALTLGGGHRTTVLLLSAEEHAVRQFAGAATSTAQRNGAHLQKDTPPFDLCIPHWLPKYKY